ncbi:MAG: hypothetical protein GEV07_28065 [Streptosporangiales bacterium]|nr:hypothetical protein [Streptosporangiales bacterium]
MPVGLIALLLALVGASYLRGALGYWRGEPRGPNLTRIAVNISLVPWSLMVLRGILDLIDEGTTRWGFFLTGVVLLCVLLGYRRLIDTAVPLERAK